MTTLPAQPVLKTTDRNVPLVFRIVSSKKLTGCIQNMFWCLKIKNLQYIFFVFFAISLPVWLWSFLFWRLPLWAWYHDNLVIIYHILYFCSEQSEPDPIRHCCRTVLPLLKWLVRGKCMPALGWYRQNLLAIITGNYIFSFLLHFCLPCLLFLSY